MRNNQFLRVKNSLLELEKDFMELTDRELKDRKEKIKREIEELLHKPIYVSKCLKMIWIGLKNKK